MVYRQHLTNARGLTAIELLASLGAIAILLAIAVVAVSPLLSDVRKSKLENDVASINAALKSYVTEGGNLSAATTAGDVIATLKSTVSQKELVAGYRGAFVDPRLDMVMQSASEAAAANWRAFWDDASKQFILADSGVVGIKEFTLNEGLANLDYGEDVREHINKLATVDDWIWDFAAPSVGSGAPAQTMATDEPDGPAAPVNPADLDQLLPPGFEPMGQLFNYFDFPDAITLSNPNDPATTQIAYSINGGSWETYTGPVSIERGDYLSAYVEPIVPDPEVFNSFTATESYRATDPEMSGTSTGVFKDAVGSNRLVSSISPGDSNDEFLYGQAFGGGDQNRLRFTGDSFSNIMPEDTFTLGELTYLNSTTGLGTSAYEVTLQMDLNFSSPGMGNESVDINLALESTANYPWLNADQKADYVRFGQLHSDFSAVFGGDTYYLNLEFVYSGADGYSTVDSFHVHEGADASAQIVGYFSPTAKERPDTSQGSSGGTLPPPPGLP